MAVTLVKEQQQDQNIYSSQSAFSSIISVGLTASPGGRQGGCYLPPTDEATGRAWQGANDHATNKEWGHLAKLQNSQNTFFNHSNTQIPTMW